MAGSSGSGGASKSLVWKGDALTEKMRAAQIAGVNKTMGACVEHAKSNHPWKNRTGILEGGIGLVDYAAPTGTGVEGTWGVAQSNYAAALELGATIAHPGGTAYYIDEDTGLARFVRTKSPLSEGLPRTKPHEIVVPAHPFLRPAADVKYPDLAGNIRKAYEKGAPGAGKGGAGGGAAAKGGDGDA